jgi:membrane protease YdiL (CAAX protease family)
MDPAQGSPVLLRVLRSAPARLVIELAGVLAATIALHAATKALVGALGIPRQAYFAVFLVLAVPTLYGVYALLLRGLERRAPTELGSSGAARELLSGLLVGVVLFVTTIGIIAALGGYSVEGTQSVTALGAPLVSAAAAAFTEELLARGILFRVVQEWLGTWAALVLSSALFGLAHAGNPHATVWSTTAIALEAGTMLGAAYLLSGRLWLPMGVHMAWNFVQGGVFGVAVSGGASEGLLRGSLHGAAWLSGVVVCFAGAAGLLARAVRAGRVVAPSWTRRAAPIPG